MHLWITHTIYMIDLCIFWKAHDHESIVSVHHVIVDGTCIFNGTSPPNSSYFCSQVRPYVYGCLSPARWDALLAFGARTGLKIIYGLNGCFGRRSKDTSMDFSNIRALVAATAASAYWKTGLNIQWSACHSPQSACHSPQNFRRPPQKPPKSPRPPPGSFLGPYAYHPVLHATPYTPSTRARLRASVSLYPQPEIHWVRLQS